MRNWLDQGGLLVMIGRRSTTVIAIAALVLAPLGACSDESTPPTSTTVPPQAPNPASLFCVEQGGTLDIVDEAGGQVGYCTLPDGSRVEEWEYYRSQNDTTAESVTGDATGVPVTTSISGLEGAVGQQLALDGPPASRTAPSDV